MRQLFLFTMISLCSSLKGDSEITIVLPEHYTKRDLMIVLNIVKLTKERFEYTLRFFSAWIDSLKRRNNQSTLILQRMRNPSIRLKERVAEEPREHSFSEHSLPEHSLSEHSFSEHSFSSLVNEISAVYDAYAQLLNTIYEKHLLSENMHEWFDHYRVTLRNVIEEEGEGKLGALIDKINEMGQDGYQLKRDFFHSLSSMAMKIFSQEAFLYKAYIQTDQFLVKSHEIIEAFLILFYQMYEEFWQIMVQKKIEETRKTYEFLYQLYQKNYGELPPVITVQEGTLVYNNEILPSLLL